MPKPARQRSGFTILDLLTVLIVGLVIGGSSLLFAEAENEDANRTRCADHLRLIGTPIAFYSNENRGACPRTMSVIKKADEPLAYTNPKPELTEEEKDHNVNPAFCKAGPGPNDVTAGLFLLLAMEDIIKPDAFLCPSVQSAMTEPADAVDRKTQFNFTGPAQLNYSYHNPYPNDKNLGGRFIMSRVKPEAFAVAADMNPGSDELLRVTAASVAELMKKANSLNHNGDGQNVLYADRHVEFQDNPFVGMDRDNVYTYGTSGDTSGGKGIVGSPANETDSVLLPTAKQEPPK